MFTPIAFNYKSGELVCHTNLEFQWHEAEEREQVPKELLKHAETAIKLKKKISLAFYHTQEDRSSKNGKELYQGNYIRTISVKGKGDEAWIYYSRYELVEQEKEPKKEGEEEKKTQPYSEPMQLN